jgi:hypothetical protein
MTDPKRFNNYDRQLAVLALIDRELDARWQQMRHCGGGGLESWPTSTNPDPAVKARWVYGLKRTNSRKGAE